MKSAARKTRRRSVSADPRKALVKAASSYGKALRRQSVLSTALHRTYSRGQDATALDRDHSAACDEVGVTEHEMLVCAAIVGGWSRKSAAKSV